MADIIYLLIFLSICYALAWWLEKNYAAMRNFRGWVIMLGVAFALLLLHNLIAAFLFSGDNSQEPLFPVLSILSLGAAFFLFVLWLGRKFIPTKINNKNK